MKYSLLKNHEELQEGKSRALKQARGSSKTPSCVTTRATHPSRGHRVQEQKGFDVIRMTTNASTHQTTLSVMTFLLWPPPGGFLYPKDRKGKFKPWWS